MNNKVGDVTISALMLPFRIFCTALLLICCSAAFPVSFHFSTDPAEKIDFDPKSKEVTDLAHVLTSDQKSSLTARIRELEHSDSTQLAVLIMDTLNGYDDFMFAQSIATRWGIGQKDKNNGALFLVVIKDHKMRIQVGYGLEGRLTDALSRRILDTEVAPSFKRGDYYQGISKGVDAIIKAVRGEYKAPPAQAKSGDGFFPMLMIFIVIFILIQIIARRGGRGGPGHGSRRCGSGRRYPHCPSWRRSCSS